MSRFLLTVATGVARLWTRLYTAGLPQERRAARREEIESDMWETAHAAGSERFAAFLQVLGRLATGMVDDLGWRWEQEAIMARTWKFAVAVGAACGVALAWIALNSRTPIGPQVSPPARSTLVAGIAPPPPPPPPTPPGTGAPRVTFTYGQAEYRTLDGTPMPVTLKAVRPVHPPIATWAGVGGTVVVNATIDEHGRVGEARVEASVPMLDQSAIDAVRQSMFEPRRPPRVVPIRVRVDYPLPGQRVPASPSR